MKTGLEANGGGVEYRHWEWDRGLQSGKDYLLVLEW